MSRYSELVGKDPTVEDVLKKVEAGKATTKDLKDLAKATGLIVGQLLADAVEAEYPDGMLSKEDARRIISPVLRENHNFVAKAALEIQRKAYEPADLKLRPLVPEYNEMRESDFAEEISRRSFT